MSKNDCILLLFHVADPLEEDVLELGDVDVTSLSILEGRKGSLEVLLDLVTILSGDVQ